MEKIPRPVLSDILSQVGMFDQAIILSLVCKRWKEIISNRNHEVSFQNIPYEKARPGIIRSYITKVLTSYFLKSKWKLVFLDLKSVNVNERILANLIIAQPNLRKLDLSNSKIDFDKLSRLLNLKKKDCMKKNKIDIIFQLEELICTNTVYFGYHLLEVLKMFPKLKKLNIGNCNISYDLYIYIFEHFTDLEFLETSHYDRIMGKNLEAVKNSLQNSSLKFWFVNTPNEWNHSFKNTKTCVCNYDIWYWEAFDLEEIKKWLKLGGNINTCDKSISNLIEKYDDDFLIQAFQIFIENGIDKWFHVCSRFCPNKYCNYIAHAALKGKLKLFWYLFDMGFHIFDCEYFNILISCPEIITELLFNEKRKIKLSDRRIYEAAQFFTVKKNEKYLIPLINYMINTKIGFIEENLIHKGWCRYQKKLFGLTYYYNEIFELFKVRQKEPLISIAAIFGMKNAIAALIHSRFNINARDLLGNTALCYIAKYGNIDILKYLIEKGADINNVRMILYKRIGDSPLKMAIEGGRTDSIIELINSGAELTNIDENGFAILEYARKYKKPDIEEILMKAIENIKVLDKKKCY